jgi:HEAT repeat protein
VNTKSEMRSLLVELTCGDDLRAELASARLPDYGNEGLALIQELLMSPEIDSRWWAVRTLAQMKDPPVDLLNKALEDGSQEVRQCAALAICHHPNNSFIPCLLKLLMEPDSITSNLAATALTAIGRESIQGLLELLPMLKDSNRIDAFRAIASIKDERAITVLMAGLDEDSLAINYWAEEGLNKLGLGMVYIKPD